MRVIKERAEVYKQFGKVGQHRVLKEYINRERKLRTR